MGRLGLAFRIFFDVLFNAEKAEKVRVIEATGSTPSQLEPKPAVPVTAAPSRPVQPTSGRSDALTLLEALQREARLLDFIQEDIQGYSDQQVGSAVRDVHRGCRSLLQRHFGLCAATEAAEGSKLTLDGSESAAQIRLVGQVREQRPVTGVVVHPGWKVERCDLPLWNGAAEAKFVLAPAEVEIV